MRMQLLMVFVLLVAMLRFRLGARAFYIVLPRVLRTYRAKGKHPLQVFAAAFRAGGNVALTDKLFEGVATFSTGVFVNWHSARKHIARRALAKVTLCPEIDPRLLAGKRSPNYTCARSSHQEFGRG